MFCGNLFQALHFFMACAFGGIGDDRTPPSELVSRPKGAKKFTSNTYSDA
jgi:hypothetical protein